VIGENVAEHPEIVARAAREGHEIGNHSWSHPNFGKMADQGVRSQLQRTDDAIKNATGQRPTLMRPPYGSITAREKRWIHDEFGYRIILWDVDPLDWKRPGPAVVRSRILKETQPGSIVLSHDIHPGTIEAMPSTFDALEAKGFKFVTVSELIRMARPKASHLSPSPGENAPTSAIPALSPSPTPVQRASPSG
jgi:peptidoglycan/xylan/chitin deacetylase (PgdA/CDA1 family)